MAINLLDAQYFAALCRPTMGRVLLQRIRESVSDPTQRQQRTHRV